MGLLPASLAGNGNCDACGQPMTDDDARYVVAKNGLGWYAVVLALHDRCGGGLTAAEAMRRIDNPEEAEESRSLGERLGFQPIHSRTHGYNGQEHR